MRKIAKPTLSVPKYIENPDGSFADIDKMSPPAAREALQREFAAIREAVERAKGIAAVINLVPEFEVMLEDKLSCYKPASPSGETLN